MNATVTRSASKSTVAKGSKQAAKSAAPPKVKTASKQAGKLPKTRTGAASRTDKSAVSAAKTAKKPAKAAVVKSALKPAVKSPAKTTSKAVPKPAARAATGKQPVPAAKTVKARNTEAKTGKAASNVKQSPKPAPSKADAKAIKSGVYMSGNNPSAGLTDKIHQTVVSKVSEVATKTTKSTPAVPEDGTLLTEAEILAMSEKDYMNEAQLAFFKARLQQLERDLLKNAGETTEHLRETVLVPDPADRATIEEEHALELRTRDRERKLLKKVQQSIASIDAGEYGWCEETGEPIGIPRLLARPTATLSLEAQQRRELKQKLYGD
jgi:DnaK suppressor protein